MAKFVLAGKADCPYYAKAELLADILQRSLPNFRVHKISVLPAEWKVVNYFGKFHVSVLRKRIRSLLSTAFSFSCLFYKDYYGITPDMSTDVMQRIAAENLQTQLSLIAEEQLRLSLIKPLYVWITGALRLTCQILIPSLLSAEMFPNEAVSLHLLDLEGDREELQRLKIDVEDLALDALHQVTVHTDLDQAFHDANLILLLDDLNHDAEIDRVTNLCELYREYGRLIDRRANKHVKVMVAGDTFLNLRCSLLLENAPSINSHQFVATATQLEHEARAEVAKKMGVRPQDVRDVIVWGNISGGFIIDLQRAKVFNYRGAIRGPAFFSQSVLQVLHDRKWLETEFQQQVRRHHVVVSRSGRTAAISAANGILRVLKAWNGANAEDQIFSITLSTILSVPATCMDGKWSALLDVTVDEKLREELKLCVDELQQVSKRIKNKPSVFL
uniref:Malate dehydrogenase 1B, NAD (soluble) n=1 Tax=Cyprinodon variegatus TaxID=28743 RepID=A0A3Q2D1Q4_CYPVA